MPKWLLSALLLCAMLIGAQLCTAQDQDTPQDNASPSVAPEPPMLSTGPDSATTLVPDVTEEAAPADPPRIQSFAAPRAPSEWRVLGSQWKSMGPDLLHDQKSIYLFPLSVARGHHLKPTLAILGATALLTAVDAHNAKWARNNIQPLSGFNRTFSGYNTATATDAFAGAFYLAAILRRNVYDQKTFMLAGEAVISAEILTTLTQDDVARGSALSPSQPAPVSQDLVSARQDG